MLILILFHLKTQGLWALRSATSLIEGEMVKLHRRMVGILPASGVWFSITQAVLASIALHRSVSPLIDFVP
ncbi:MAG: hypothetical protein JXR40_11210, partial [Pontiellaceae bacterium]|nr:hypothetical protein [Pontiellaceae bacterium]